MLFFFCFFFYRPSTLTCRNKTNKKHRKNTRSSLKGRTGVHWGEGGSPLPMNLPPPPLEVSSESRGRWKCVAVGAIFFTAPLLRAKMSTRENVHLTILRQRILIRSQNPPVKSSRENVHHPRIWTPNSLHFAHGGQNLLLSFDCISDWFWGFCTLPDQNLPRHKTSVLLTLPFHLVLSSTFRLSKEMHTISPSNIAVYTGDAGATYKTLASTGVLFTSYLKCPFWRRT